MMDLKRLRTFVTVADLGTVTSAAATLRITQPALSRQLQDLQAEFGVPLFEQVGRRLQLTAEGSQLLQASRALLGQADTLLEHARSLSRGDIGELRVGATSHMIANVFPDFLRRFAAQYPSVRVKTVEAGGIDQWELLRRGDLHAAVAVLEGREAEFIVHPLPLVSILIARTSRRGVSLASRIEIRDLAGVPLLLLKSGFGTRKVFDAASRLEGMVPNVFLESSAPETLLALARAGHGWAIVPTTAHIDGRSLHLARLYFRGKPLTLELAVLWNRERRLPRYAAAFNTALSEQMRTAIPQFGPTSLGERAKRSRPGSRTAAQ
ncbi:MAG: LysR family transcriptional regulator [Acidobacteriota bacterium]